MSPQKFTPLALAALVLCAGTALAVPVSDHGPPADEDRETDSFAPVPVYGPVLDDPVFTILAQEPREDLVYGPGLNEDHWDLRVLPDNWHQLTEDADDEDLRNPWADSGGTPIQDSPAGSDDGGFVPCGCPSHDPGHHDGDDSPNNDSNTGPVAPNDDDDVDNDDGMDGDDSDASDTDGVDPDDNDSDADSDSDGTDADGDGDDSDDDSDTGQN